MSKKDYAKVLAEKEDRILEWEEAAIEVDLVGRNPHNKREEYWNYDFY